MGINKNENIKKSTKNTTKKNINKTTKNSKSTNIKNPKVTKINNSFESQNFIYIKKVKNIFIITIIIFILLLVRIGFIQFVNGSYLKELAYRQQAINQIISPKRGDIYDSKGETLATSVTVDTITINPSKIVDKDNDKNTPALKEKVAKALSDIFELDYEETLTKVNSTSQVETIIKKVEKDKVDKLKDWMENNKFSAGINIDEDTKRYYPHKTLLSQVIGSCGTDNQGLSGIEVKWNSTLTGTPGKIVSSKSGSQEEIPNAEETYIAAENGSNLTLTIDLNVQNIVEKYLKQAVENNNCQDGGVCIVMEPKTGDILAMATYPNYDLNTPFTPNETLSKTYSSLNSEEKANAIYKMWSNKAVNELYEPGSVFKVITSAIALEENITETDIENDFNCTGHEYFEDMYGHVTSIACWRYYTPHNFQTLRKALQNSCNPAFIQLGKRIGTTSLYKYYRAFGLQDVTDIDLPGEANSLFIAENKVGPIERATMSFGQRLNITPLQMIRSIAAICNDGMLMRPRIVKEITNTDTGSITTINTQEVRQVISKETANEVKSMMESVVSGGTGGNAKVSGYAIGGKTGTSEPIAGNEDEGYVASFVGISPIEDTKVVLLVALYNPTGPNQSHQGGAVAAPVAAQMLTEILPYLDVPSDIDSSNSNSDLISVPDIRNKTITEAEKVISSKGFKSKISTSNDKNSTIVIDQNPKPGTLLSKNSIIMIYDQSTKTSTTVPNLSGMSVSEATNTLRNKNLNILIEGSGTVISQDPTKDSLVEEGTVVKVTLKQSSSDNH